MSTDLSALTDSLVSNYIGYRGCPFIVFADKTNLDIGYAIINSANALDTEVEKSPELLNLDDWRKGQPLTSLPQELREELEFKLQGPDEHHNVVLYIMHSLDGEQPMKKEIVKIAGERGKIGGLPECTVDVLAAAFHPDNNPSFNEELYNFMLQEEEVLITCDRGTNLNVVMDHDKYTLINSNGVLVPGKYGNPIPAEVFAHPVSADGKLVISGSYGPLLWYEPFVGNYQALVEALDKDPVAWKIKEGRITDVICSNKDIQEFVRKEVFETDTEHGMKIGEFGLPANLYVLARAITGNLLIDEKGRVHIAQGHGYQKKTGCEYDTPVHGDGLVACATLISGRLNQPFMVKNVYSPELFKTLSS